MINDNSITARLKEEGTRIAKQMRRQNRRFVPRILAPREVDGGDTIPLRAVFVKSDWKIAARLEMVESATDMITNAYIIDALDPAFPTVLASIIEGKGLYEHNIGEFFQLYGKFEGIYQTQRTKTKTAMEALVNGDNRYLKLYREGIKCNPHPLPYAVRNILAHTGHNPNTLDHEGKELEISIELLRSWTDLSEARTLGNQTSSE